MTPSAIQPAKKTRRRAYTGPNPPKIRELPQYWGHWALPGEPMRPDERFDQKELWVKINSALLTLPEREFRVVKAHLLNGQILADVAAENGLDPQEAVRLLTAGRARLRRSPEVQELLRWYRNKLDPKS